MIGRWRWGWIGPRVANRPQRALGEGEGDGEDEREGDGEGDGLTTGEATFCAAPTAVAAPA